MDSNSNLMSLTATDDEISLLSQKLSLHMQNKLFFNPVPFKVHHNIKIYESYATKNLRQSFFEKCDFMNADFSKAGLAGSVFVNSTINPCNFKDTNLQSSDFRNCFFCDVTFEYTRMNKSTFYNTRFVNCVFKSVSLNDAIFDGCEFLTCQWIPISIENTLFRDTVLSNITLQSMNFEFTTFENIRTKDIKLPFPTIPFIFNGLTYISETNDNIRITSALKKEGLTAKEYLQNIPDLEKFYFNTQNYFPLSNILICQKRYKEAFEAIILGIEFAINLRSFRMIKYYCKQIKYIPDIEYHQLQEIYNRILIQVSSLDLQQFEKDNLNLYLPEVRELLLKESDKQRLQIFAKTNIVNTQSEKISFLISSLDLFLCPICHYSIELRHNSPYEFFLDIFTNQENISLIISGLSLIVGVLQVIQGKNKEQHHLSETQTHECEEIHKTLIQNQIKIDNLIINNNGNIIVNSNKDSIGN